MMNSLFHKRALRCALIPTALAACFAQPATAGNVDNLLAILNVMTPGSWQQVSLNTLSSVAPPLDTRPFFANDNSKLISAWSGFTWDSKRGDLLLFGGGHANYSGNEVYRWDGATQTWARGSLPSDIVGGANNIYTSKGGVYDAPAAAHTYDSTNYLAVADRMLLLGGASFNTGGGYVTLTGARTGPYMWDPAKADPNKVGGATGTGVNPATQGGNMWQNRATSNSPFVTQSYSLTESGSVATVENGKDVVYFTGMSGSSDFNLYRYQINDVNNPALDTVTQVGRHWGGPNPKGAAAYDPNSRLFVTVGGNGGGSAPSFSVFDLDNAGPGNDARVVIPTILGGGTTAVDSYSGIDWDPSLGKFLVWSGGGTVWALTAPQAGTVDGTWTFEKMVDGNSFAAGQKPSDVIANGVWGKWKYISELNAFIAIGDTFANAGLGNVNIFKPMGWINPVPEPSVWMSMLAGLSILGLVARRRS